LNDKVDWNEAVTEGRAIVARADQDQMRLGELADQVDKAYGENSLAKFGKEIGVAACTLKRRRSVYRAYKGIGAPVPLSQPFSVLQELAVHPQRDKIIVERPQLTKREARDLVRQYHGHSLTLRRTETERWLREVVAIAGKAVGATSFVDQPLSPEAKRELANKIEPSILPGLREGGEALLRLADCLEQLWPKANTAPRAEASAGCTHRRSHERRVQR
jgi:hypothetical protein